ncbi:type II secretion system protein GspG, partial [Pseudomonas aeruginosa]
KLGGLLGDGEFASMEGWRAFTLYSQGADGQPGGKGLDADVGYAPKR